MKKKTSFTVDGQTYVTVSAAAKLLGTTPSKIRTLMGDGTLEWSQTRLNGQIVVSRKSLNKYMLARLVVNPSK